MKTTKIIYKTALALKSNLAEALKVQELYVASMRFGVIKECTASTSAVSALLVSWLEEAPFDIAIRLAPQLSHGAGESLGKASAPPLRPSIG
jgi:hypothetical protein